MVTVILTDNLLPFEKKAEREEMKDRENNKMSEY